MIEIRFHGRGGQGSVTAAEILAKAAFKDGKYLPGRCRYGKGDQKQSPAVRTITCSGNEEFFF